MPCPEHGVVGGAVAVTSATLSSELEQPDKTEPTEAIPKQKKALPGARLPAFAFCFIPLFHVFSFRHNRRKKPLPAFTQSSRHESMNHRGRHHAYIA